MIQQEMAECACGCGQPFNRYNQCGFARRFIKGHHNRLRIGQENPMWGRNRELNGNWRGGRYIDPQGYVRAYRPEHPHANPQGYVQEHRVVMEEKIGRQLKRIEIVHHINRIRDNNDPNNLMLFANHSEHTVFESRQRKERLVD